MPAATPTRLSNESPLANDRTHARPHQTKKAITSTGPSRPVSSDQFKPIVVRMIDQLQHHGLWRLMKLVHALEGAEPGAYREIRSKRLPGDARDRPARVGRNLLHFKPTDDGEKAHREDNREHCCQADDGDDPSLRLVRASAERVA